MRRFRGFPRETAKRFQPFLIEACAESSCSTQMNRSSARIFNYGLEDGTGQDRLASNLFTASGPTSAISRESNSGRRGPPAEPFSGKRLIQSGPAGDSLSNGNSNRDSFRAARANVRFN